MNIFLFVLLLLAFPLEAGQHKAVPVGHRAYQVIESAELRGLIQPQISVKPYPASEVLSLLNQLSAKKDLLNEREIEEIEYLLDELTVVYVADELSDILLQGSYRSFNENLDIGIAIGGTLDSQVTSSLTSSEYYDVRSSFRPYLRGDISDFISIYMDFGLRYDKLDNRVFLDTDFTIPGEGFYMLLTEGGARLKNIPDDKFYTGLDFFPEISLSFLSGALQFRMGNILRDWGVGHNNLQLSGSARAFEAVEGHIEFSNWLSYSFIMGSLGIFSLETLNGDDFFSDSLDDRENYQFNSNYSAKRVEVDLPWNVTVGIFESCVWQKRFEIGYLNPFGILMFQQNLLGDFDNMLAGVDFQWRIPGLFRLHGTWSTSEMNEVSLSRFFTAPRNIMAYQAGVDVNLPVGVFSNLAFQYTRLDAFFYTHYTHEDGDLHPIYRYDDATLETAYVNKGENLGYPLNPNSDELLVKTHIGLGFGLVTDITMKYQRRSGQYGYEIDMPIDYDAYKTGEYDDKHFSGNLFEQSFSIEFSLSKQFVTLPLNIFGSYRFSRVIDRDRLTEETELNQSYAAEWNEPTLNHVFQVGFHLY
ncbi:MAG: hypothetical protein H8D23_22780 [Candidatus Brocadiales bacterium]|nr:hypothetical protein [Candidatus Brocadiales bacterium]